MATADESSDEVLQQIQDRSALATTQLTTTNTLITNVRAAIEAQITALAAVGISITTSEVTYVPPTDTAPTLPTVPDVAIGDTEWDRIIQLAQAVDDRTENRRTYEASNLAANFGHEELSETQTVAAARAADDGDERDNTRALTNRVEQAKAKNTDTIAISQLGITLFQSEWETQIRSEGERRAYADLELRRDIEPERIRAEFELKKTDLEQNNAVGELVDLVQIYAQLTTGLFSASDVGLNSSVSVGSSTSWSTNYSGECSASATCSYPT